MQESGLFAAVSDRPAEEVGENTVEQRLDRFTELAKEASQLAGRVRTSLHTVTENARSGDVANAAGQLNRIAENLSDLSSAVAQLKETEESLGVRGRYASTTGFARELESALVKQGIAVSKGPEPYWLVYPAWFKIERNTKGALEVILNGDKLETQRPTEIVHKIAAVVGEKINTKQVADLLLNVRQVFRRAGAPGSSLLLEDIYEVLALEPGKRAARRKDFTKGAFYYAVHRLAEELDEKPAAMLDFPSANKGDIIFFTKDGESRKYLAVEFTGARPS